jgi:hypothetical protein
MYFLIRGEEVDPPCTSVFSSLLARENLLSSLQVVKCLSRSKMCTAAVLFMWFCLDLITKHGITLSSQTFEGLLIKIDCLTIPFFLYFLLIWELQTVIIYLLKQLWCSCFLPQFHEREKHKRSNHFCSLILYRGEIATMTVLTCSFIKTEIVHVLQIVQQRSSEVMNLTVNLLGIKKRNVSNQINAHIRPSLAFATKNKMKRTKKGLSFLV